MKPPVPQPIIVDPTNCRIVGHPGPYPFAPIPEVLDKMVDAVLAYRPKPKSKAAKKRRRKAAKKEKS